ncbi:metalloendopeptidase OMA1, mitochondrial-like [Acyrthosiphon pisum]|uniref:Metalloendopeptidase OMA1, mitochondrial n=1 Tax=Acyrthosiphon pisum TaxID=7029 RepID=A0A8R2AGA6_ACYPI|nr:metalloendopeptidase OMA1, mitochondrial-like [Acyrthosiphon pisum]|eukprot:XP_003243722.1 PREDICTED: metalloendopeptidase OMA1, mitochondrial-like [Acyrthosiphon pisum]
MFSLLLARNVSFLSIPTAARLSMSYISGKRSLAYYKTPNVALKTPKQSLQLQNLVCHTGRRGFTSLLTAVIGGAAVRYSWFKLPPETRRRYANAARTYRLAIVAAGLCLIGTFLSRCMEFDPWTDLWRLFLFSERTVQALADKEVAAVLASMTEKCCLLETEHPTYRRVAGVMSRLLYANNGVDEIRNRRWSLVVVDHPAVNAFVLASGFIFVFSGLAAVANDDQLSIVVGHELAHVVLRHTNHINSVNFAVHLLCLTPVSVVLSVALPFLEAMLAVMVCRLVLYVCVGLTKSRSLETEADALGFLLAANACVDVTQGYLFWETMSEIEGPSTLTWWLETHPTNEIRGRHIHSLIPAAVELQKLAKC